MPESVPVPASASRTPFAVYGPRDWPPGPPEPHLIEGVCRSSGSIILYGPTGLGKTTLAWQFAQAWAQGQAIFGLQPCRPLRMTFVEADMFETEMGALIKEMTARGCPQAEQTLVIARRPRDPFLFDFPMGNFMTMLRDTIRAHATDMTIFDAVPDLHLLDPNDQADAARVLRVLEWLTEPGAYFGIFGSRKQPIGVGSTPEHIDGLLGSQQWPRRAHTVWRLRRHRAHQYTLHYEKARLAYQPAPLHLDRPENQLFIPSQREAKLVDIASQLRVANPKLSDRAIAEAIAEAHPELRLGSEAIRKRLTRQ